ncbi:Shikimate 5-dehydrogenase I alpha [hydrothermal vent metagenome]|uniref:shikimate dehydrogenase (NADP(+)) n=1 Tax=hydrothermal vent metagenome TaxID=652676 RepID=A0A3B1B3V5_9ZZZZ
MNNTIDHYAVIGNPIEHSKSPLIHHAFAEQTGERLEYTKLLGEPGHLAQNIADFMAAGGKGLNVTVPFKEDAWQLVSERNPRAESARAVNTIIRLPDGRLRGENTDGIGLVRDLQDNLGVHLQDTCILLLGAGGAARGVLQPLLKTKPRQIVIANRTTSKAIALAQNLAALGSISGCGLSDLNSQSFDLIINATAAGLTDTVPDIPDNLLKENGWCYDMMYGDKPTAFMRWGQQQGAAKTVDGLGMLVEQAAESFFLWRGIQPDTAPVILALRHLTSE